jgi:hypothetical protein
MAARRFPAAPQLQLRHSKAVSLWEANGFALSPIRAVFLDSNRWVVEPTVKM